ncbi:hypothetical protein EHO51_19795 (plasmid) [Methylocystis rosea]|uniref:Uncharacterized protein n=1 Tax=Methylocystis rosea TaxID=173366 RepID=A0A3G8MAZ0_9HYPH|nr:hypothetical protein EHO51_19795 [Methylocystis rosea]QGM95921.1 hypothetical protein F7D13_17720 [Methylocystis rosea]
MLIVGAKLPPELHGEGVRNSLSFIYRSWAFDRQSQGSRPESRALDLSDDQALRLSTPPGAASLLAGVSIVGLQGRAMLAWLQGKTIGQNRTRFSELACVMLSISA